MLTRVATVLILALLAAGPVAAGTLHPGVENALARMDDHEMISVIAHMADRADVPALSAELTARKATRAERHREVVLALQRSATNQSSVLSRFEELREAGDVAGYTPYWITNAVVFEGTPAAVREIAARQDVGIVVRNFAITLIEPVRDYSPGGEKAGGSTRGIGVTPGLRAINAPRVWYELGINGTGALVANLDTGVDGNHPALGSRWRGNNGHPWQECWLDVLGGGSQFPVDFGSHGTHVMGTITGLGAATEDTIGVAWGALWIACNAVNQSAGPAFDNDVITAYQWFADPDGDPFSTDDVPDVVQNSWRINENFGFDYTDCDDRWWDVIDNAEASGVVTTWSAGNEGPGARTIGSPADRITTPYNTFSVGAVDATNFGFPYPIAGFSSRGPSGCDNVTIKPEVVAPGVDVYSSVPGGGYQQSGWSGTSMAGPHVAGVAGLIRSANPDIEVEVVKQLIFDAAIDFGSAGEDNTYGAGFIDAYEAVIGATVGFGTLEGTVTHAVTGAPIPNAIVRVIEADRNVPTDETGHYSASVAAGTYTVRASHPAFIAAVETGVAILASEVTVQNFALEPTPLDGVPPVIHEVAQPCASDDVVGPYTVSANVTDNLEYVVASLFYNVDDGPFTELPMTLTGSDTYAASIPGQPLPSTIGFYIEAQDAKGNTVTDPPGAPAALRTILITPAVVVLDDDVETDQGWALSAPGDNATTGRWERTDPQGTFSGSEPAQPEDDHTAAPGVLCFVTDGDAGGSVGDFDVDNGCTTLLSPIFDLTNALDARINYWRWWFDGTATDDELVVDISNDGGSTWTPLERLAQSVNEWTEVSISLCGVIEPTDQMQLRVVACDDPNNSLVEAAIDDVTFEMFEGGVIDVADNTRILGPRTGIDVVRPNPFNPMTRIVYSLDRQSEVSVKIFDLGGREVTTLAVGLQAAGTYSVNWDGTNRAGRPLASGTYFVRMTAGGQTFDQRVTLLK
jgi:subtilisin family serine protease